MCASFKHNIMNGDIPTHLSGTSIDKALVSPDLSPDITSMVGPSVLSSDHFLIVLLFDTPQTAADSCQEGWNYKKGKCCEYAGDDVWSHFTYEMPHQDSENIVMKLYTSFR